MVVTDWLKGHLDFFPLRIPSQGIIKEVKILTVKWHILQRPWYSATILLRLRWTHTNHVLEMTRIMWGFAQTATTRQWNVCAAVQRTLKQTLCYLLWLCCSSSGFFDALFSRIKIISSFPNTIGNLMRAWEFSGSVLLSAVFRKMGRFSRKCLRILCFSVHRIYVLEITSLKSRDIPRPGDIQKKYIDSMFLIMRSVRFGNHLTDVTHKIIGSSISPQTHSWQTFQVPEFHMSTHEYFQLNSLNNIKMLTT